MVVKLPFQYGRNTVNMCKRDPKRDFLKSSVFQQNFLEDTPSLPFFIDL